MTLKIVLEEHPMGWTAVVGENGILFSGATKKEVLRKVLRCINRIQVPIKLQWIEVSHSQKVKEVPPKQLVLS